MPTDFKGLKITGIFSLIQMTVVSNLVKITGISSLIQMTVVSNLVKIAGISNLVKMAEVSNLLKITEVSSIIQMTGVSNIHKLTNVSRLLRSIEDSILIMFGDSNLIMRISVLSRHIAGTVLGLALCPAAETSVLLHTASRGVEVVEVVAIVEVLMLAVSTCNDAICTTKTWKRLRLNQSSLIN